MTRAAVHPSPPRARRRRRRRARPRQGGVAIFAVITAIAICLVIVNEFGSRTTIDMMQARNNLDAMRGHFLVRSSLDLTELILRLQSSLDRAPKEFGLEGVQITEFADPLVAAFGGDEEQVQAAVGIGLDQAKGLGSDIGTFGVRIRPVDGKINVNCARAPDARSMEILARQLQSLLFPIAFNPVFEEPDAEGWRRDRNTQVAAIIDYIDRREEGEQRVDVRDDEITKTQAPEDYGYETLRDAYKPKNNALDSVAELKLVRGVDDRFWTLFGNAFRAGPTGQCRVNLRAVDDPKVIAAVIALAAKDQRELRPDVLWAIANMVIQAKQFGMYFTTVEEFATFVADPAGFYAGLLGGGEGGAPPAGLGNLPTLPPGVKGIELDTSPSGLGQIAESTKVRTYDVEAWGEVARTWPLQPLRRTSRAMWDQEFTNQQNRSPLTRNGTWRYLREE